MKHLRSYHVAVLAGCLTTGSALACPPCGMSGPPSVSPGSNAAANAATNAANAARAAAGSALQSARDDAQQDVSGKRPGRLSGNGSVDEVTDAQREADYQSKLDKQVEADIENQVQEMERWEDSQREAAFQKELMLRDFNKFTEYLKYKSAVQGPKKDYQTDFKLTLPSGTASVRG